MSKIKIISNPYNSEIKFQEWLEDNSAWIDINYETKQSSKLIGEKIAKSFFPFNVTEIVNKILSEYSTNKDTEPVSIVFEGTNDEYEDLCSVCADEKYKNRILVERANYYIENARDVLPEIIKVFDRLHDLASKSVRDEAKVIREIERFREASNEVIPICVLGTYSAGKSTFINALIGSEVLPSSDQPTTAKIYKISKSSDSKKAKIKFNYNGDAICLRFYEDEYRGAENFLDNPVSDKIQEKLSLVKEPTLVRNMNKVLCVLNAYTEESDGIAEIIEIEVPFQAGILDSSDKKYVIFDTPGSNSVSNEKHLVVLKKAMANLSNGLPIYISEFQALDTQDNAELHKVIEEIKELDDRFTMIIVNKADQARLAKEGFDQESIDNILKQAVPKKMNKSGLFFVSSIMGLGSKNEGNFIDDYYSETYDTQHTNYSDTQSRYYKQLFQYNIIPEQMKKKQLAEAKEPKNKVYANSGLFTIEKEIETFANKYSSYNKCKQSRLFLDNIISITSEEIALTKQECGEQKLSIAKFLEEGKQKLIENLDKEKTELEEEFIDKQLDSRIKILENEKYLLSLEELEEQSGIIREAKEREKGLPVLDEEAKEKMDAIGRGVLDNLKETFQDIKELKFSQLKEHGKELYDDFKKDYQENKETQKKKRETIEEIEKETSDDVLDIVRTRFDRNVDDVKDDIESDSKKYWTEKTKEIREKMVQIVTGSSALSEIERNSLADVIMTYEDLVFENYGDVVFNKEKLLRGFKIWNIQFGAVNKLDLTKITSRFRLSMEENIDNIYLNMKSSHELSFKNWLDILMSKIKDNIVDFNPDLKSLNKAILEKTELIRELEYRQSDIEREKQRIKKMMEWKRMF